MGARKVRNNFKEPKVVAYGRAFPALPYVRKGSLITARQCRNGRVLLTVVPKLKKDRGFGKPFTVSMSAEEEREEHWYA